MVRIVELEAKRKADGQAKMYHKDNLINQKMGAVENQRRRKQIEMS